MKAVTYTTYGPPDVLCLREVERPEPASDEVLIRVRAAEATKADCEMRSFNWSVKWFWLPLRLALGVLRPRRQILGAYFSGEIVAVGSDVADFTVGDAVYGSAGLRLGAYGQFVALPAKYTIVAKPKTMNFFEAAAVPLGGLNALHFMRLADLSRGEEILVIGAGGVIGAHAVQIAKSHGAIVTAVDKGAKEEFLRGIGADDFIDYEKDSFIARQKSWDVIFDMVPGNSYSKCMRVLKSDGRYFSGNPRLYVMLRCIFTSRFTKRTASFAFAGETKEELLALTTMAEDGRIVPIVDRIYPMDQAAAAHRRVEAEERLGAVVIDLSKP